MKKLLFIGGIVGLVVVFFFCRSFLAEENKTTQNSKPIYVAVGNQLVKSSLTPFSDDEGTRKIMRRNDLQDEGRALAKKGFYEEAIAKYEQALDPSLLNYPHEGSTAKGAIIDILKRQGKFELALQKYLNWFYNKHPNKEQVTDEKLELESLIQYQRTSSPHPVHAHIRYLREKYKKYLPPNDGMGGLTGSVQSTIIHLYSTIGDPDGGIAFVDGILAYLKKFPLTNGIDREVAEYQRVKQAFQEDKRTGTKGHLRQALENSSFISW